ncbi:uncharacterized protein BXZ73DRAFT_74979 [Epithele typhae]|uniref:uncharacterized protein n=1 Tax=Epithele typhae TaxID=378194 RepID=UPI0020073D5E|nr:uncharacterized protein BXZ73DRAFT_74979 [Epithele typhae]KAH9941798.1 hypothetical protein BXZ73DRAFT_74979 [Epithele typhae]
MLSNYALVLVALFSCSRAKDIGSPVNCSVGTDWVGNHLQPSQTPCTVAAWLLSPCAGDGGCEQLELFQEPASGLILVRPKVTLGGISETGGFYQPGPPNECTCNAVSYAALAVCSWCQGGTVMRLPYTIPNGTAVPAYMYPGTEGFRLVNNTFDVVAAQSIANTIDSVAPSSATSPAAPLAAGGTGGTSTASGLAGNGLIGGLIALALALVLVVAGFTCYLVRRRRSRAAPPPRAAGSEEGALAAAFATSEASGSGSRLSVGARHAPPVCDPDGSRTYPGAPSGAVPSSEATHLRQRGPDDAARRFAPPSCNPAPSSGDYVGR